MRIWMVILLAVLLPVGPLLAQDESEQGGEDVEFTEEQIEQLMTGDLDWQIGPVTAPVGHMGEIDLPEGFRVIGGQDSRILMERFGNLPTDIEQATVTPVGSLDWWFIFEFEAVGYVGDQDDLDPDDLLETLKAGNERGNEMRRQRGLETLELVGWEVEPRYNPDTNNLEWAIRLRGEDGKLLLNHNTRILGRRGVMRVTLVVDPGSLAEVLPTFRELLGTYRYAEGNTYAEYVEGDKIAEYGLAALITGGAIAVAAKTGLLARFWKFILIGLVAIGGFFKKLFGGGDKAARPTRRRPAS